MLRLTLFGPFQATLNGAPIAGIKSRDADRLLALLALHYARHGEPISRLGAAKLLWPEDPRSPPQLRESLRKTADVLTGALGSAAGQISDFGRDELCLALFPEHADVTAFDLYLRCKTEQGFRQAVALYNGPVLSGWDDGWIRPYRSHYADACIAALGRLLVVCDDVRRSAWRARYLKMLREEAARSIDDRDWSRAEKHLQVLKALQRDDESLWGDLLDVLIRGNQRISADKLYAECVEFFQEQRLNVPRRVRELHRAMHAAPTRGFPAEISHFIGREREARDLQLLISASRLVTLVGSAKVGKTRLAVRVAKEAERQFPDGAWFVDLTDAREPDLVRRIAHTLEINDRPAVSLDGVTDSIRYWHALVVLDGCEAHQEACATLSERLLRTCPHLVLLCTTRHRLGVVGERQFRLTGMDLQDGVRLYEEGVQRASDALAGISPLRAISHCICLCLAGIPYALSLAAETAQTLPPGELASQLDRYVEARDGAAKRPAPLDRFWREVQVEYELLSATEQAVLRRLSVFRGDWDLSAAREVCAGPAWERLGTTMESADVAAMVAALADRSLVAYDATTVGRYSLANPIRALARDWLCELGEAAAARHAHLTYYLALAESEEAAGGQNEAEWLARLDREWTNVQEALEWSEAQPGQAELFLRLVVALGPFWSLRGRLAEGRRWLDRALSLERDRRENLIGKALRTAGILARSQGDCDGAAAYLTAAVALYREMDSALEAAGALAHLALVRMDEGGMTEAEAVLQEAQRLSGDSDSPVRAEILQNLGNLCYRQGATNAARSYYEMALQIRRNTGDLPGQPQTLCDLALVQLRSGHHEAARAHVQEALSVALEVGDRRRVAIARNVLGMIALNTADLEAARSEYMLSLAAAREIGDRRGEADALNSLALVRLQMGHWRTAQVLAGRSLAGFSEIHNKRGTALAMATLGRIAVQAGDVDRARGHYQECLLEYEMLGDSASANRMREELNALPLSND